MVGRVLLETKKEMQMKSWNEDEVGELASQLEGTDGGPGELLVQKRWYALSLRQRYSSSPKILFLLSFP